MDLIELLRVLWRWKLVVVAVTVIVIGAAYGVLRLMTPLYESSTTLFIEPVDGEIDPFLLQNIDAILPVYADAVTSRTTLAEVELRVARPVDDITVEPVGGTPLLKIHARDSSPERARVIAQAVTDVLIERTDRGQVGGDALKLTLIEPATAESEPVFPRIRLTLLVAGLLGLALAAAAALVGETVGAKADTASSIEELLGVPCFGELPTESAVSRVFLPEALTSDGRLRRLHEALRDVRTNLQLPDHGMFTIVVTSPDGHHGKSTVATGLATSIANSGRRTLLIDGDLRRGRISEIVGLAPSAGFMEALTGAPVEELVRSIGVAELEVLTRGGVVDDPGDLLRAYPAVLRQIQQRYDVVVIDTTPVTPVNDARVLSSFANAVLLVVNAETATKRKLRAAMSRLELLSIRPTAFILNRSKARPASDYYITVPERNASGLSSGS
jgi:receptor protein-tyrosine kinase